MEGSSKEEVCRQCLSVTEASILPSFPLLTFPTAFQVCIYVVQATYVSMQHKDDQVTEGF